MHSKNITKAGKALKDTGKALVMVHGRGANSADILSVADHLEAGDFTLIAPQATNNTWYPYSFMVPENQNEPWLSSALDLLEELEKELVLEGIAPEKIFFLGFSQGACLMLEYITRHAKGYGGAIAFTGGLIGEKLNEGKYKTNFAGTPIFIGSSNPDPHVPVARIEETERILKERNAEVVVRLYPGMGHTISMDEIHEANRILRGGDN